MEDKKKQPSTDYNIYNIEALRNEVIKLISKAYCNGYEAGKKAAITFTSDVKEATVNENQTSLKEGESECSGYKEKIEDEKPIKSCADCIFCYLDKSDFVFKCKYYDDISVYLLDPIQCDNRISSNEFLELKKRHYKSLKDFFQIIDAFNYFKKDGGCDSCGSQRCPADARMMLEGNYCEEFKKWCAEE